MNPFSCPPVLLTMADFYGTLAAARCLGRSGISITMAESQLLAPARWSRYVTNRVSCPRVSDSRFMEWLLDFGKRQPGHVLYPTSDDLAWLYALHRQELSRTFRLLSPKVETIEALLDKKKLTSVCAAAGIEVPQSWFPANEGDLASIRREARFPLLVKPRTQILFPSHSKGVRVESPEELKARYRELCTASRYDRRLLEHDPEICRPIVQTYFPEAARGIYSLAGFSDGSGVLAQAAMKILQRPRRLGIGLCFEEAEMAPEIVAKIETLCLRLGYRGVFEAEFVPHRGRHLLIDFNPRFYSQMAFDIARGLPLPLLAYEAACGQPMGFASRLRDGSGPTRRGKHVYCHRFLLEVLLRSQRLSGRISQGEAASWRTWYQSSRNVLTDAVADDADRLPQLVDLGMHLLAYARHPRDFVRSVVLES